MRETFQRGEKIGAEEIRMALGFHAFASMGILAIVTPL